MNTKEYMNRLGQISKTLNLIADSLEHKEREPFFDADPKAVKDAIQLISDLKHFNALQGNPSGSFISMDKVRPMNDRYNKLFAVGKGAGELPLFTTQFWSVNASKLNILTSYMTNDGIPAETIRIYPGIVTKAEDETMADGESRFTFIFTAIDSQERPIRNDNLNESIKKRIRSLPSDGSVNRAADDQFDVLEEIGTCKPPASCTQL